MAKKLSIDRSRPSRATSIHNTLLKRIFLQRHSSEDTGPGSAAPPCHHPARRPCAAQALKQVWERDNRDQSPTPEPQGAGAARSRSQARSSSPCRTGKGVHHRLRGGKGVLSGRCHKDGEGGNTIPLQTGARWPMPWPSCTGIKRG